MSLFSRPFGCYRFLSYNYRHWRSPISSPGSRLDRTPKRWTIGGSVASTRSECVGAESTKRVRVSHTMHTKTLPAFVTLSAGSDTSRENYLQRCTQCRTLSTFARLGRSLRKERSPCVSAANASNCWKKWVWTKWSTPIAKPEGRFRTRVGPRPAPCGCRHSRWLWLQ